METLLPTSQTILYDLLQLIEHRRSNPTAAMKLSQTLTIIASATDPAIQNIVDPFTMLKLMNATRNAPGLFDGFDNDVVRRSFELLMDKSLSIPNMLRAETLISIIEPLAIMRRDEAREKANDEDSSSFKDFFHKARFIDKTALQNAIEMGVDLLGPKPKLGPELRSKLAHIMRAYMLGQPAESQLIVTGVIQLESKDVLKKNIQA